MGSLERFKRTPMEVHRFELEICSWDILVAVEAPHRKLSTFRPLQTGQDSDAFFVPETSQVLLPPGSVAAINVDDEELLLKHFKKRFDRGRHQKFAFVMAIYGGEVREVTRPEQETFYFMDGEQIRLSQERPIREFEAGIKLLAEFF